MRGRDSNIEQIEGPEIYDKKFSSLLSKNQCDQI